MLKIIADQFIYHLADFLPNSVDLQLFNPSDSLPTSVNPDILLVRTVTKLQSDKAYEQYSGLKVVGTASSGSDHLDTKALSTRNIQALDAKGCNANAVSEYVITSLLLWSIKRSINLKQLRIGIIGVGATGSAVMAKLDRLGISTVLYDPPRAQEEPDFISASIAEVLSCDILTFHTPLTKTGDFPTFHWLDEEYLLHNEYQLIINASRGGVIDETALLKALNEGRVKDAIIDVWENEPDFNPELASRAFIATPHIAGYSEQAKLEATRIIINQLATMYRLSVPEYSALYEPKTIDLADLSYTLYELLLRLNPIKDHDAALRDLIGRQDKARLFTKLREDLPYRYEYPFLAIDKRLLDQHPILRDLGFSVD